MISEFDELALRINELAGLVKNLRAENAELRQAVAGLEADKATLSARIDEAHLRVTALLEKLPESNNAEEGGLA